MKTTREKLEMLESAEVGWKQKATYRSFVDESILFKSISCDETGSIVQGESPVLEMGKHGQNLGGPENR